jgi:hypothetical protein
MRCSSKLAKLLGVIVLGGCQTPVPDPPPPVSKAELPSAAPRAVGALAAGTDGAPRPDPSAFQDPEPERGDLIPYPDGPPSAHGGSGSGGAAAGPAPPDPNAVEL